jgi:hypothetical protein
MSCAPPLPRGAPHQSPTLLPALPQPPPCGCRGPLLEASVDLEQRFWHALTRTGEWTPGADALCFEEVTYTLFTLAQVSAIPALPRIIVWMNQEC